MRAVLFDLDGTLIDSLPNIRDAANAVLAERGLPALTSETIAGFVGLGEQVFIDRLIGATDLEGAERAWVMERFIGHYRIEAGKTVVFHGVVEALTALHQSGTPVGLVTNKPRAPLGPTLASAGIEAFFDVVVAGDDLPKRKPDPMQLTHAMAQLGVADCVYVGDSET
ncbi:MAG: HAD-IA family hydrolase, partial [Pseudomonadota bacterium]